MTKPRPLPNAAKEILADVRDELLTAESRLRAAALAIHSGDTQAAMAALMALAVPVGIAERAITAMLAGDMRYARQIIEDGQRP